MSNAVEPALPNDAIPLQQAQGKYGHSRDWYKNHVYIWYVPPLGTAMVSESAVISEHEKSQRIIVRPPDNQQP